MLSMLRAARISYRESNGNFLTPATIWVEQYEFSRASAVVQKCIAEYGASHTASRKRPTNTTSLNESLSDANSPGAMSGPWPMA